MAAWLREEVVRKTWGDPEENLERTFSLPDRYGHALIVAGGEPVGYLRWAHCTRAFLATVGIHDLPEGAVDIDIFLGRESARGRGVGPRALGLLAERLFAEGAPVLGLISSASNLRAHAAFEKAGWRRDRPYEDDEFGPCWLFLRWAASPDGPDDSDAAGRG